MCRKRVSYADDSAFDEEESVDSDVDMTRCGRNVCHHIHEHFHVSLKLKKVLSFCRVLSDAPDPQDCLVEIGGAPLATGKLDVLVNEKKALAVAEKRSLLRVGSTVVVCPDESGQATDRESKYFLGLNIGRIESINEKERMLHLWWYWGTKWEDQHWILWRVPKSKRAYMEWVSVDDLVTDELDHIVRIDMENVSGRYKEKFKLSKDSLKSIQRCLNKHKGMLYCMSEGKAITEGIDEEEDEE